VSGPYAEAIRNAIGECWIASSFQDALEGAQQTPAAIATLAGDVFRGSHLIDGGSRDEGRGILATKREIKDLRDRIAEQRTALARLAGETAAFESMIAQATAAITALNAEHHTHEKAILALELQLARVSQDTDRLDRKFELIATERRRAEEERTTLAARQQEARESIQRLEAEQRAADERLALAQRRLFEAREAVEGSASRVAEARVAHAALLERAAALAAEVARLEEASGELDLRVAASAAELQQARTQQQDLRAGLVECVRLLDDDIAALNGLRDMVRGADDAVILLRDEADGQEIRIREARHVLEEIRAAAAELDVERATAESDLTHLAASCAESVQASLEEVVVEVEALERDGALGSAAAACLAEPDEPADEQEGQDLGHEPDGEASGLSGATTTAVTAEEAIRALRARLDRLGPVNMMAIEQFDELETRHTFLTTQRKDLVDSIAATAEAIKRIDQTSRARFEAAFNAINQNFQETFSTLFGGGRAGLALLDEADLLEAGIEIIASPPGKRLQNVQLLSGGEKALTAIALMFAIFKYKPSPFCLLDEIDAPLDDANIGRFIEMLRAMLTNTQFILITHNRKTMEIADRLYGVTMEEPGVSKLISVRLN
jgi:chromosome segregation protein